MKNSEIKSFSKKVFIINGIISLIAVIVLLILGKYDILLGYLLGVITSYLTYLMHARNVEKIGSDDNHPIRNAIFSTGLRFLVSASALLIALFINWIDLVATFVGLLVIKVVIIVTSFILDKKGEGEGKK